MANEDLWTATSHDRDEARLYPVGLGGCVVGLQVGSHGIHLTREALAGLVRAAAPLAGLTVAEPGTSIVIPRHTMSPGLADLVESLLDTGQLKVGERTGTATETAPATEDQTGQPVELPKVSTVAEMATAEFMRGTAATAIWGGRRRGETGPELATMTEQVAHYIATGSWSS